MPEPELVEQPESEKQAEARPSAPPAPSPLEFKVLAESSKPDPVVDEEPKEEVLNPKF